ncbi:MAG: hypothetical protein PHT94_03260 [Candidatus Nanoarchaeia archaeon]|nr:hypothetical protein [Candidatus Nanoarchaeia archaeon]
MTDNVVSYVGISDRVAYRKLILLSSKDVITALNTYEQIKVVRKKKHELMRLIDENLSSILKVKEKLDKSFPPSAYESLMKSIKIKEEEEGRKTSDKDFEKYLNKMKGAHKKTKDEEAKEEHKENQKKVTKIQDEKKEVVKTEEKVEVKQIPVEQEIPDIEVKKVELPKKVSRFEKLQQELEDIESKLSNL